MKRDRDALLNSYARMAPDALYTRTPEERHQVYRMLRLGVVVRMDGSLELSGTFGEGDALCHTEAQYSAP